MTTAVLMMLTACILIAAGALGNGLEVKEVKIPQIGTASRIVCFAAGFILLAVGLVLEISNSSTTTDAVAEPATEEVATESEAQPSDAETTESDMTAQDSVAEETDMTETASETNDEPIATDETPSENN